MTDSTTALRTEVYSHGVRSAVASIASRIHIAAFRKLGQSGWSEQSVDSLAAADGAALIAAYEGEQMAGFILIRSAADEAELLTIAVDPGFQRAGVASLLIEAAKQKLEKKSIQSFFLEVRRDNAAAIACYKKLGFEKIAVRKDYYTDDNGSKTNAEIFRLML